MRPLFAALLVATAAAPLAAQDAGVKVARGGDLPSGWTVRLDRANAQIEEVRFQRMGEGYHVTLGPSAIFYHADHQRRGDFEVEAEMTQMRAPRHPEAFGIFIGGNRLETPEQRYTYFLVRGDGRYMIRHRAGNELHDVVNWTEHDAVVKQDAEGRMTNRLTIRAEGDAVTFSVNGTQVARFARAQLHDVDGQAGLRINHNLDVHVEGWK